MVITYMYCQPDNTMSCQIGWDWLAPWLGSTVCQQLLISSWHGVKRMCGVHTIFYPGTIDIVVQRRKKFRWLGHKNIINFSTVNNVRLWLLLYYTFNLFQVVTVFGLKVRLMHNSIVSCSFHSIYLQNDYLFIDVHCLMEFIDNIP